MIKLVRITTVPISLHKLINGQANFMQKHGFEVHLLSAKGKEIKSIEAETKIKVKTFPYTREISPFTDIKALWLTYKYFRKLKPQIVHTHTPKAGIVGMLAAKFAGVPVRMHTVAGLPLMEASGIKRFILNSVERLTSWAATNIYPNSIALKAFMLQENLANKNKLKVIGYGSSNGINTSVFDKKLINKAKTSTALQIKPQEVVFCFVGRIVKDKGIDELLYAFDKLSKINKQAKLLLVGSQEKQLDPISNKSQYILEQNKQIISVGWQQDVRPFLAVADVFVFPSYREGFPNVVLQASAMQLPCIVSNINGCNEIIKNNVNGIIIPVKDKNILFDKMNMLLEDKIRRENLAKPARQMIIDKYEQKFVWQELLKEYKERLKDLRIERNRKQETGGKSKRLKD